jgi:hypothetical protein
VSVDTGSLGRKEYVDPQAIADAAAESVHQAYAPVIDDYQRRIGTLEQLAAGGLAAHDVEAERQQMVYDAQLAEQATRLAAERLDATYGAGWFAKNGANMRAEIEARPGLLPDAALQGGVEEVADALEMASRKVYAETKRAREAERSRRPGRSFRKCRPRSTVSTGCAC